MFLWGPGPIQRQLIDAVHLLFEGKSAPEREETAESIVAWIRKTARGSRPGMQTDPFHREEHLREGWARMVADQVIGAAMLASERSPCTGPPPGPDQRAMLREIVKLALWHMPNAVEEARELVRYLTIERFKQPHRGDDPPPQTMDVS
jgi:hypothetical protein